MSEQKLIEITCPDCSRGKYGGLVDNINDVVSYIRRTPPCETCGGTGKVLVDRSNLIKVGGR